MVRGRVRVRVRARVRVRDINRDRIRIEVGIGIGIEIKIKIKIWTLNSSRSYPNLKSNTVLNSKCKSNLIEHGPIIENGCNGTRFLKSNTVRNETQTLKSNRKSKTRFVKEHGP